MDNIEEKIEAKESGMVERIAEKLNYFIGLILIGLVFGLTAFASSVEVRDPDLWLHIATGRFITDHGFVPGYDVLSCSIPGKAWVNHEWLFQVLVSTIYKFQGTDGLILMQTIVVMMTMMIFFFLCYNRNKQMAVAFMLLLVLLVYQSRFTIRPDIFSLLFFGIDIFIIAAFIHRRWAIYALFLVQVLWSNVHGFFFLGPFIILISIFSELIKRYMKLPQEWSQVGRLTDEEYLNLQWAFIFAVLACFLNPLTLEGAYYPIKVLLQVPGESKVFFDNIQELQRPITSGDLFSLQNYPQYRLLILLSFYSFLVNLRRLDIGVFIFWLAFLAFSLVAKRNLIFFSFAAYLVCMTNIMNIKLYDICPIRFTEEKFRFLTAVFVKVCFCFWIINFGILLTDRGYFDFDKYERKSEYGGVSQRFYPNKAVDFLVNNKVQGNFFNDFNSGAYLLGRCFPDIKVFIDGRTEVYGAAFFKQYQKMWGDVVDKELFDKTIEKLNITGALLNSIQFPVPEATLKYFFDKKWAIVYFDYDAVIFLKDTPENKPIIDQYQIDLSQWKAKGMDLKRLAAMTVTPFPQVNRAFTLEALGFDDAALAEAQEALKVSPGFVDPYKILGKIYGKRGDHEKAFENFRIATMVIQRDTELRYDLALAYENLEDFPNAIKQYLKIIQLEPQKPKGYFTAARAYAKNKQYDKVLEYLNQAYKLDPIAVGDLVKIGDLLYDQKEFKTAKKVFELALTTNKDLANIHHKLGLSHLELGEKDLAREEFNKGLSVDANHEGLKESLKKLEAAQ